VSYLDQHKEPTKGKVVWLHKREVEYHAMLLGTPLGLDFQAFESSAVSGSKLQQFNVSERGWLHALSYRHDRVRDPT
jgi:hypothetical protein